MSFVIEKEEIEIEIDNNDESDNNDEPDNNSEPDNNDEPDNNEIIINEKKNYNFTPARAKALAKGRLTRPKNLAINKLKVKQENKEIEKNRLMELIAEMNLIPAKPKKNSRYVESDSDTEDMDNNLPSNNYNSGYF
jgi:hypothetical protein